MIVIFFAQTMFGCMIAFRILRRFRGRALLSAVTLTKIGTTFAAIIALGSVFLLKRGQDALILSVGSAFALQFSLMVGEKRQLRRLADQFPQFLERWILNLKMGAAGTPARERALADVDPQFRALLSPIFETSRPLGLEQPHPLLSSSVVQELRTAQTQPHNTLARVQNLRATLARASAFRRKSGQAVHQAVTQSLVLLGLHGTLVAFLILHGAASACVDLIVLSSALTLLGTILLQYLARRIKWTI